MNLKRVFKKILIQDEGHVILPNVKYLHLKPSNPFPSDMLFQIFKNRGEKKGKGKQNIKLTPLKTFKANLLKTNIAKSNLTINQLNHAQIIHPVTTSERPCFVTRTSREIIST